MNAENLITLTVEGFDSEQGHVRADDFAAEMDHLLTVLNGIDRSVSNTGNPTLYYRIVAVSHGSPLSITLEPVVREGAKKVLRDSVQRVHSQFFAELGAIRAGGAPSIEMDDYLLEHLRALVGGHGQSFKAVVISNHAATVELDRQFEQNVSRLLKEEDASYGHAEGTLEAVNIHGGQKRFWIYPRIGPPKIKCDFGPGTSEQLREALGKYIRVEGVKYFRPQSPFPYRIAVRDFETAEGRGGINDLRGVAPGATGKLSSVDFVRAIRDEWD